MKSYTLKGNITVVEIEQSEIEKIDMDLCKEPRETLSHYYNRMPNKPEVLINGGLFNLKNGKTCFTFVDDYKLVKEHYAVNEGLGTTTDLTTLEFGKVNDGRRWNDFIAGYPVLVENGVPITKVTWASEINYRATRSAIGITRSKKIIVLTVGKPGMIFQDLAKVMANDLGCQYAINLDGGGSSRLMMNGKVINKPTENRSVDSVIAVYLKHEEKHHDDKHESGKHDKHPAENKPKPQPPIKEEAPYVSHTVKRGDTLWDISAKYLGSGNQYKQIVEFNHLKTNYLRVGQVLKIPVSYNTYKVKYGDSMWSITAKTMGSGAKYPQLMAYNGLKTPSIRPGQILKIPT